MRRCKIVSQTGGVPAEDAHTVFHGAKTIRVPALDFHTVCDAARSLSDRRDTCRRLPDSATVQKTVFQTGEAPARHS
ncbi:hypothetical protein DPMN_042714 [Dreissena polymorpha]|uniref:Uncharacterized protein n=1 Tax=Dreissena polymorpha TaxID=45954 RepID=A0A9D4D104_DREPO|nr:hypothetical protein DPMN_042714 [Dreissena polymorpha]